MRTFMVVIKCNTSSWQSFIIMLFRKLGYIVILCCAYYVMLSDNKSVDTLYCLRKQKIIIQINKIMYNGWSYQSNWSLPGNLCTQYMYYRNELSNWSARLFLEQARNVTRHGRGKAKTRLQSKCKSLQIFSMGCYSTLDFYRAQAKLSYDIASY